MTAHDGTAPGRQRFVSGNSHLDQLLADPQLAADVAAAQADAEEMDRAGAYYWIWDADRRRAADVANEASGGGRHARKESTIRRRPGRGRRIRRAGPRPVQPRRSWPTLRNGPAS